MVRIRETNHPTLVEVAAVMTARETVQAQAASAGVIPSPDAGLLLSAHADLMGRARESWPRFVMRHAPESFADGLSASEAGDYLPRLDHLIRWLLVARDTVIERRGEG